MTEIVLVGSASGRNVFKSAGLKKTRRTGIIFGVRSPLPQINHLYVTLFWETFFYYIHILLVDSLLLKIQNFGHFFLTQHNLSHL